MTITQHAHIYNFHTSNLCLKKYFFLKFLSMPSLVWAHWYDFHRHTLAALHSYSPYVAQILSLVTWGVKMMSLCHGWGYHPIQTALYILMRYTIIWAFGMLSQGFMMGAPPWDHSTSQVGPWFGNSWSLMGKNDAIMSCLRLTFTSDTFPHPYEMYSNCLSFWYAVSRV